MVKNIRIFITLSLILLVLLSGCIDTSYKTKVVDELNIEKCTEISYMNMGELDEKYEMSMMGALKYCDKEKCCVLETNGIGNCFRADCVKFT